MTIGIDMRHGGRGGVPEYVRCLVDALLALDTPHTWVLFHNAWRGSRGGVRGGLAHIKIPSSAKVKVVATHLPNKLLNGMLWALRRPHLDRYIAARAGLELDVMLVPNLHFFAASKEVKVVATAHDISFDLMPYYYTRKMRAWHHALRPRRFFAACDHVIAVSEHTKRDLVAHYGIPKERITTVYEGVDPIFTEPHAPFTHEVVPMRLVLPEKYILMMGAREARKNTHGALLAYAHMIAEHPSLTEYKMLIIGTPSREIMSDARLIAIREHIIWYETFDTKDRPALYKGASLLLYPSFYEGFGLPPLEAMACGVPVIVAANSASSEVSGEAAYMVNPYDVQSMADALKKMLTDGTLRAHYREAGRQKSLVFTWKKAAQETLTVLERVAAGAHAHRD